MKHGDYDVSTVGFDRCVDMDFLTIHEEVWGTAGDGKTRLFINSRPGLENVAC